MGSNRLAWIGIGFGLGLMGCAQQKPDSYTSALQGSVIDDSNNPVAGVEVLLTKITRAPSIDVRSGPSSYAPGSSEQVSGASGEYHFSNLPSGFFRVVAKKGFYYGAVQTVSLEEHTSHTLNLYVTSCATCHPTSAPARWPSGTHPSTRLTLP